MVHSQLIAILLSCSFLFTLRAENPNVILVMLDDSGWTGFGCYGSEIDTPNIDKAAKEGIRFTDCHSAAPNCSPARAGILTGRTPSRVGMYSYRPPGHVMHLKSEGKSMELLLSSSKELLLNPITS